MLNIRIEKNWTQEIPRERVKYEWVHYTLQITFEQNKIITQTANYENLEVLSLKVRFWIHLTLFNMLHMLDKVKGTVTVIPSDPPCKDARFTTDSLIPLSQFNNFSRF